MGVAFFLLANGWPIAICLAIFCMIRVKIVYLRI
jgi:hypothetical protein